MIAPFFYAWERRLHSRTPDRVVRPFEWGLDWVPRQRPRHRNARGRQVLADWARAALADSPAFFAAPPTARLTSGSRSGRATPPVPARSRSRASSPRRTPRTTSVYGRLFPAARKKGGGEDRRRAVVVLPQWNADAGGHVGLSRLLARFGINALRLSLPYHDRRMPPIMTRADFIVSSNVARTVQVCRQAVVDARRAVAWLAREGYERIGILGTSLGSCLAMLTSAHEPLIRDRGAEPHLALLRRRGVGRAVHRARARRPRRPHHAGAAARAVDADQPAGVRRRGCGTRRRCSSTRATTRRSPCTSRSI